MVTLYVFCLLQILWTFSIYLESVAILPQLFMISKTGEAETITTHYLFFLGLYRALYLINWIWRFYFEGFFDMIAIVAGVVQTILYCDFFYLYVTKGELHMVSPISLYINAAHFVVFKNQNQFYWSSRLTYTGNLTSVGVNSLNIQQIRHGVVYQ